MRCCALCMPSAEMSSTVTSLCPRASRASTRVDAPPPTSIKLSLGRTPAASSNFSDGSACSWNQLRVVLPRRYALSQWLALLCGVTVTAPLGCVPARFAPA